MLLQGLSSEVTSSENNLPHDHIRHSSCLSLQSIQEWEPSLFCSLLFL
jgi:hypothetical protein